ncbi:MAG: substrate-binding domain-containing protein [Vicinamibacteria bacterium]|nr:substrate-binding domain-containing protein [Vicinamibacteria bacterium]
MALKIAVFLTDSSNPHQLYLRDDAQEAARRAGWEIDVQFASEDGKASVADQVEQIDRYVHGARASIADALLVHPIGGDGYDRVAQEVARVGCGLVILNRNPAFISALRRRFPSLPLAAVGPDQFEIGRIQGQQFRALLPQGGTLLYVQGAAIAPSAQQRLAGMTLETRGTPVKSIVLTGDWLARCAEESVMAWLREAKNRNTDIRLIGCQNDAMAYGARRALHRLAEELGRPELRRLRVTGCDGVPAFGQRLVEDGDFAATIVVPPPTSVAIGLLARYFERGDLPLSQVLLPSRSLPDRQSLALIAA